ncbi:MAG TPA: polysaccharide biosynthesis/export family protein [Dongiaceae bacterium]|nr:polysaccharide biosynthesis/export family protein [Dongiaceae bacterium]
MHVLTTLFAVTGYARRLPQLLVAALLSVALAACTPTPDLVAGTPHEYTLGPGDKVQLAVYGQAELSGQFTLDASASVSLPKAGVVQLGGKTLREAEQLIAQRLTVELKSPEVSLNIIEYRPVYVMGEVQRPGQFPFVPGMTVLNAVALASGYKERADPARITIVRASDPDRVARKANEATSLEPGDTVNVLQRWF